MPGHQPAKAMQLSVDDDADAPGNGWGWIDGQAGNVSVRALAPTEGAQLGWDDGKPFVMLTARCRPH